MILDMRPECSFTDYFVIATGRNPRQTACDLGRGARAAEAGRAACCRRASTGRARAPGSSADYLDVVLHVFTPDAREFYELEELWSDVPAVDVDVAVV